MFSREKLSREMGDFFTEGDSVAFLEEDIVGDARLMSNNCIVGSLPSALSSNCESPLTGVSRAPGSDMPLPPEDGFPLLSIIVSDKCAQIGAFSTGISCQRSGTVFLFFVRGTPDRAEPVSTEYVLSLATTE
jgi:hypothetical protein